MSNTMSDDELAAELTRAKKLRLACNFRHSPNNTVTRIETDAFRIWDATCKALENERDYRAAAYAQITDEANLPKQ